MNILKPKMAKNAKMQVLGPKSSKMTAPNFWSNSLFGASTVFKENCQTKGGPHKTPQEAANCRTNNLLKLQMAIWDLKMVIWELQLVIFLMILYPKIVTWY